MRIDRRRGTQALLAMLLLLAAWTPMHGRAVGTAAMGPHLSAPSSRESVTPDVAPARVRIDVGHDGPRPELVPIALLAGAATAAASSYRTLRRRSMASPAVGRFVVSPAPGRAPPVALFAS